MPTSSTPSPTDSLQPLPRADRQVGVLEADASRQLLRGVAQQVAAAALALEAVDLRLGPLDVAEVGEERARPVRADHRDRVRPGEPGQPADVHEVGDEQRVELALAQRGLHPVGARGAQPVELPLQDLERLAVAVDALALHGAGAQVADHGHAAPLLALVDGRQVHLDRRQAGDLERVADRPRVVRPRARVQQDAVLRLAGLVQLLAELALAVRLEERRLEAQLDAPTA